MAYYARFVPYFATFCIPLNYLKRKRVQYYWEQEQSDALKAIKVALTSKPIRRLSDFDRPFILQTDGSGTGLGAQLEQDYNGIAVPVAYVLRPLNKHERNKSTLELECSALVFGLQTFQQYLDHRPIRLKMDSSSLSWLLPRQVGKMHQWIAFINFLQFTFEHIRGENNHIPDLLSRMYDQNDTEVAMIYTPTSGWSTQVKSNQTGMGTNDFSNGVNILTKVPEVFKDISVHQREDPELLKIIKNHK